ncbi:MAG: thermonuclease family protein [Solimonas sp.]
MPSGLLLFVLPTLAMAWQCEAARLVRVHDGDTITVRCGDGKPVKLRFANIDAPELHQAYGSAAREALVAMLGDRPLRVTSKAVDRYERVVATVELGDRDAGLQLVADGYAWCGLRPTASCREALQGARAARRGLWHDDDPQPPWQWRRAHPRAD